MRRFFRATVICGVALALSGCWEAAVIHLGGQVVIAGISAIADAADDNDSSSPSSIATDPAPSKDGFCLKSGTNKGYIPRGGKCDSADRAITSTEYYSTAVVRTSSATMDAIVHCYDQKLRIAYTASSGTCQRTDVKVSKAEYDKYRADREAEKNKPVTRTAYCYAGSGNAPYEAKNGICLAGHKKISEEQYKSEMAKAGVADIDGMTYCYDKNLEVEYQGHAGACQGSDTRISKSEYEASRSRRADETPSPKPSTKTAAMAGPEHDETAPAVEIAVPVAKQPDSVPVFSVAQIPPSARPEGSGTAFYVSADGYALTNQHVVEGCRWMAIASDTLVPAQVVAQDKDLDLALLRTEKAPGKIARFGSQAAEVGQTNFVVGYPLLGTLNEMNMTNGIVSSLSGPGGYPVYLQTTAAMQPGNSGGPVFTEDGLVVGVAIARLKDEEAENVNFAIKGEHALSFLRAHGLKPLVSEGGTDKKAPAIAKAARAFTFPALCFN